MKRFLIYMLAAALLLCGCNKKGMDEIPKDSVSYNEKGEVVPGPQMEEGSGSVAAGDADYGVRITYEIPEKSSTDGLTKTVLSYYFKEDKVSSLRVENTYSTSDAATAAAKDFAAKPESCREVTVFDKTLRYYSSKDGIGAMQDVTKDTLKEVAETLQGSYEEF